MIRFHPLASAKAAIAYFSKSDGAYYIDGSDLHREVGGKGAALLNLTEPNFDQFSNLLHGLHPTTGQQLTAKLQENRIPGWDITASIPKSVTIALERGDTRIHAAIWEAGRETMADMEKEVITRMKGGREGEKTSGNWIWYAFEHPETRPAKADNMPDPDRHIHFVVPNLTWDAEEKQWKAIKFRPIMEARKYFDRRFDMRLASKLTELGYAIETKQKNGKYTTWDIKGMPHSVVQKFSRRTAEVEKLAAALKVETPMGKDKLGATSRSFKRKDLTIADYRTYWDSRVTPDEARAVAEVIKAAIYRQNPKPQNTVQKAVQFAVEHEFYTKSTMPWQQLAITAMERSMGGAKPEEIEPEAKRQGVMWMGGEV